MTRAVTLANLVTDDILTVDNVTDRVGIGTTTPSAQFQVGTGVSVYGNSGIVSATAYYGSGANLTGITGGATLSAGSGDQKVVLTSRTAGQVMTTAGIDAELTYNSGTNTLSATTFSGALTGNVTGNASGSSGSCTGNSATATVATNAQGLTGTPDITVRNIIGVGATLSGVLTYEDVTNIDSVGIVTARTGVRVNAGGIVVTAGISTIGAGVSVTGPYKENITAMGALEVDCSQGNYFTKTIAGNSTFTFANVPTGCAYAFTLELTHSSGTVTWPASVKFPADTAPTLTAGKTHLFMFITDDGGTRFRGSSLVDYVN